MIFEGGNASVKMLEKFQNHSGFGPDFIRGAQICTPPGNSGMK